MPKPLVSVVIPAYNAGRYIADTLDAALTQTYSRREVIVVDDGSTDDTRARLEPYRPRIRYIEQKNAGAGAARNRGIQAATGDYIAFLDADDLWRPETLDVQVEVAQSNPQSGLVACDGVRLVGTKVVPDPLLGGPVAKRMRDLGLGHISGHFYRDFLRTVPISCPSQVLMPAHVPARVGLMVTGHEEAEDWDYTLRIARHYPVTLHSRSLVTWRIHDQSRSGRVDLRPFEWALWKSRTLSRQRRLCLPEDRALVEEQLRDEIRTVAYELYCYSRTGDATVARRYFRRLLRWTLREPRVGMFFLATWVPESLIGRMARGVRLIGNRWKSR
jgi:glycosyltransferase involved in cell wall biosynthesis